MDNPEINPESNPGEGGELSPDNSQTEVISALTSQLENLAGQVNQLRSGKDKSNAQTNRRLSEFEQKQEELVLMQGYLTEYGTPEKAARAMAIDAMLQGDPETQAPDNQNLQSQNLESGETTQNAENNLVPLLGVDEKDPAFVALVGTGMTPNQAATQVASQRAALEQANNNPNAASGIAPGSAGGGAGDTQQSVLESEYSERLSKVQQGDWKALGKLKDDMRRKGYEVY